LVVRLAKSGCVGGFVHEFYVEMRSCDGERASIECGDAKLAYDVSVQRLFSVRLSVCVDFLYTTRLSNVIIGKRPHCRSILHAYSSPDYYLPHSREDNTFGSVRVCVSVRLSVDALLFEPFDL